MIVHATKATAQRTATTTTRIVAIVHGDIGTGSKFIPRLYRERGTAGTLSSVVSGVSEEVLLGQEKDRKGTQLF
jgi:hypothetical protein